MISIKRNSKEFKLVKALISEYEDDQSRKKYIRLYSLKPYEAADKKVLLNTARGGAVLYDLAYDALHTYFLDRSKKLFREEKKTVYYFKSAAKSDWLEYPFEFTGKLRKKIFPLRKL